MSNFTKLLLLITLGLTTLDLSGQTSCGQDEPFLLPPTSTFCADSDGFVTVSFKIYNNGDPGTYRVNFPDGTDTVYLGVVNTVTVEKRFLFNCQSPPGKPAPPRAGALYYEYSGALTVVREDCVDERGDNQKGTYDFRVVPNPINEITYSDVKCVEAPFEVNFNAKLCSEELAESFQWYVDGVMVDGATNPSLRHVFDTPGTHTVAIEVETFKGCAVYRRNQGFTIDASPVVTVSYTLDSTQLCNDDIQIIPNNQYKYANKYQWSTTSPGVTFSDASAPNPVINISNDKAGLRTITVEASNGVCSGVKKTITVETQRGQQIDMPEEIITCTGYVLQLCEYLNYTPTPESISWSANKPGVHFSDPNAACPTVTFDTDDEYLLMASGFDACGERYDIPVDVRVRDGARLQIDFSSIDTLCTVDPAINLLDYIVPAENVSRITGNGVVNNIFDPSAVAGTTPLTVIDSCGAAYEVSIYVIPQEVYNGIDPTICQGDTVDLAGGQPGTYSGTGVKDGVFYSDGLSVGTYRIAFSSLTYCGGEDTVSITVQEYPRADFVVLGDSCAPGALGSIYAGLDPLFVESRSTARSLCFSVLETGQQACGREKAKFVFATAGVYTLQQVVAFPGGGCSDTLRKVIEVIMPPVIDHGFVMDSTSCDSLQIDFAAGIHHPGVTYDWKFSNLDFSADSTPHLELLRPLAPEVLGVKIAVENACYVSEDTFGVALPQRFRVSFSVLNDNNTICSDDTVFLANTSVNAHNYRVTFPDGRQQTQLPRSLVLQNFGTTVLSYPIRLEGSNTSCPDEVAYDTVHVLPITTEAAFGLAYDNVCSSGAIELTNASTPGALTFVDWGDGSSPQYIDDLETLTHRYQTDKDRTFKISLAAQLCGIDTFRRNVTVRPSPDASFDVTAAEANCVGREMIFQSTAAQKPHSYTWDFGDGTGSSRFSDTHRYANTGTYRVYAKAVSRNGCSAVDSLDLTIGDYDGPAWDVTTPASVCEDALFGLDLRAPQTGWTIDYGNGLVSQSPIDQPYSKAGKYTLKLRATSANGCSRDSSAVVAVQTGFEAKIQTESARTIVELGDELDLDVHITPPRNITELAWTGDSIYNRFSPFTTALPINDGFYTIHLTDTNGCTASDSIRVIVNKDYEERVFVPNIFSPNGDGYNDRFGFEVKSHTVERVKYLRVISRYGAVVYECQDCQASSSGEGWDGTVAGRPVEQSVYIWAAEVEFIDGSSQLFTGDVTLLR
ncbi:gliding motility-associated-like protein [Neolewinella xylanilytica]|uniref:Gliding motility-associated-like protein n=1 Tax=Neolewinella xylanilytica TaxID=1514080 RepID=A0A2S6I5E0_9BACT|nr:PKD domain-containing protein [Neolewinella xylanilytica]PPK86301.1 gliding motility-associated-like protein [Neolewinella xylanilytica]